MCKKVVEYIVRVVKTVVRIIDCYFFWNVPEFEPERWNDGATVQECNNCYNYACNIQTNTYAQPGYASGNQASQMICQEVTDGAVSDGLKPINNLDEQCELCGHKVALAVGILYDIYPDYHWYRQDKDGTWSHKPGEGTARNTDNSEDFITDPETADRGDYSTFCGFFCVGKGEVRIDGPRINCYG